MSLVQPARAMVHSTPADAYPSRTTILIKLGESVVEQEEAFKWHILCTLTLTYYLNRLPDVLKGEEGKLHDFAREWMQNFDAFYSALTDDSGARDPKRA